MKPPHRAVSINSIQMLAFTFQKVALAVVVRNSDGKIVFLASLFEECESVS